MVADGNEMKQYKHTIIFGLYTITICILLWLLIWIISNWIIKSFYPNLISNMFYIIVIIFNLIISLFIIWIIRQSYLQFRNLHTDHTKRLNEAISEFVEEYKIVYAYRQIHFVKIGESHPDVSSINSFDFKENKYWIHVTEHLQTGKTYKNLNKMYTDLIFGITDYNDNAKDTINIIEKGVTNELQHKFPNFIYENTGGNCILRKTIVNYIWNEYWNKSNQESISIPIVFREEKVQLGKPEHHLKTNIRIGTKLLASYSAELEIKNELKELVEKLVSNQEFKQLVLNVSEIGNNTKEIFDKFTIELDSHSKIIESNQDIDGKCEICPNMFF